MNTRGKEARQLQCRQLVPGKTSGEALVSRERISFWGGFDPQTGLIVDRYSGLRGKDVTGKVLILLSTKGSSGTSGMLSLASRAGHAPAAMIHVDVDPVAVMGCLANRIPFLQASEFDPFEHVKDGDWIEIDGEGTVTVTSKRSAAKVADV